MKLNFPIIKINNIFSAIIHKALKYMIFLKKNKLQLQKAIKRYKNFVQKIKISVY